MDGIQVVDETVVQFFTEMEKENGIYLDDDVDPSGPKDIVKT